MKKIIETLKRKWTEYLLDIIVIIIGILGAFALNSWNEDRIANISQKESLKKLTFDLESDIIRFQSLDSLYLVWGIQAKHILEEVLDSSKDLLQVNEYTVGRLSMNYLTIKMTTYEEMVNTGLFYKLNDLEFKSISEYYEFANYEIKKVNLDNQDFYNWIMETGGIDYLNTISRIGLQRNLENIDWTWLKDPNSLKYKTFEARIAFHQLVIRANRLLISRLIAKSKDVIFIIKDH